MHDEPAVHVVRIFSIYTLERLTLVQPTPSYPSNYTFGYSDTAREGCFIAVRIAMVCPNMVIVRWRNNVLTFIFASPLLQAYLSADLPKRKDTAEVSLQS
jgi:hypothetical protein